MSSIAVHGDLERNEIRIYAIGGTIALEHDGRTISFPKEVASSLSELIAMAGYCSNFGATIRK